LKNPIVKCPCCRKVMTKRSFERHKCEPEYKQTKTILATEIIDITCKGGKPIFIASGYDGVDYIIKVQKPIAIPLIVTDEKKTPIQNRRQGNRTFSCLI
jgi:hypothetical protein